MSGGGEGGGAEINQNYLNFYLFQYGYGLGI